MESALKTNWELRESCRGRSTMIAYEEWRNWQVGRSIKEGIRKYIKSLRKFRGTRIDRNCKGRGSVVVFMQEVA